MPYSNSYLNSNKMIANNFNPGTKNSMIFSSSAPYRNKYQGHYDRLLFVCSAGLLRSPTGATMAAQRGHNARSAGSNFNYALIPVTANLIAWADQIVCVNQENLEQLEYNFLEHQHIIDNLTEKVVVLDIPDEYEYMDPKLQACFEKQYFDTYSI